MPRERSADLFFRSAVFPNVHGPFPVLKAVADLFFRSAVLPKLIPNRCERPRTYRTGPRYGLRHLNFQPRLPFQQFRGNRDVVGVNLSDGC